MPPTTSEWVWKGLQITAWGLAVLVYYFNDASALRERMAISETKVEQETRGYAALQAEFGRRLDRLEDKLDQALTNHRRSP